MKPDSLTPRVVTSCSGRFHIFDQARELNRHGMLRCLITDYPAAWPARYGVPADRVRPLLPTGYIGHGLRRLSPWLPATVSSASYRLYHDLYSARLAHALPPDMNFFIGLSSFCLDALERCKNQHVPCAVDHGSLHQTEDALLVREEATRWGVPIPGDISPDWIVEKEDAEFGLADHVFVLSNVARDSLIRQGIRAERIFVNPCGVNLSAFYPGDNGGRDFRVIQVGAISLRKGVPDLLEAYSRARLPAAELWFIGGGMEASGLKKLIGELAGPSVRFLPPVPQAGLRDCYAAASVAVLASVADGFGMVVPQAMACGLPVIVTENVGARDLVEDGVNGFVVPIRSPERIAEKLRFLHDNPEVARQMGLAALRTVSQGYSWAAYGDRLAAFLSGIVARDSI